MSHGGHTASSGPSAKSDMDHTKTGLSEATASFVAANASPFTNPDNLISDGARVPDPSTTQRTCSTTIYTSIQIPVIPNAWDANYTGPASTATSGKQFIIVNANPLGVFAPVQWAMRETFSNTLGTGADETYFGIGPSATSAAKQVTRTDPLSWAKIYDYFEQGDLISKLHTLAQQSSRHRIVGCAVKVNTGTDNTMNRGQIEAGQFEIDQTRSAGSNVAPPVAPNKTPTANGFWYGWDVMDNTAGVSTRGVTTGLGQWATRMYTCDYNSMKMALSQARNQNRGILKAEDGASVRWTDSNNFQFQRTLNKCCMVPELDYYANGYDGEGVQFEETPASSVEDIFIVNCNVARASSTIVGGTKGRVCVKRRPIKCYNNGTTDFYGNEYFCADNTQRTLIGNGYAISISGGNLEHDKTTLLSQVDSAAEDFDRGLYIDVTGVSPNQLLNVEVQWIVEYIPKVYSLDEGRHPPVDINFPAIQAMVNDPNSYPIVVKGNSFFSSLWHGIKAAAEGVGKLLKGTSSVAAMIPDPRAQAFAKFGGAGGELLTGGGLHGALSRVM